MIKYIERQEDVTTSESQAILSVHANLVRNGWVKNYYPSLRDLNEKVLDQLGTTKHLELAIRENKIVGFIVLDFTDKKIALIEVLSEYHGQGVGKELILFLQQKYIALLATIDSLKPDAIKGLLIDMGFTQTHRGSDLEWKWPKT